MASATLCIFFRAASSFSSPSNVAAPRAAISPVPTNPAPNPEARSPSNPVSSSAITGSSIGVALVSANLPAIASSRRLVGSGV